MELCTDVGPKSSKPVPRNPVIQQLAATPTRILPLHLSSTLAGPCNTLQGSLEEQTMVYARASLGFSGLE